MDSVPSPSREKGSVALFPCSEHGWVVYCVYHSALEFSNKYQNLNWGMWAPYPEGHAPAFMISYLFLIRIFLYPIFDFSHLLNIFLFILFRTMFPKQRLFLYAHAHPSFFFRYTSILLKFPCAYHRKNHVWTNPSLYIQLFSTPFLSNSAMLS